MVLCLISLVHLGVIFICFNVDHRILWGELTEDVINDGFQFYTTFYNAPPAIKVCYIKLDKSSIKPYFSLLFFFFFGSIGLTSCFGRGWTHWFTFETAQMG